MFGIFLSIDGVIADITKKIARLERLVEKHALNAEKLHNKADQLRADADTERLSSNRALSLLSRFKNLVEYK